LPARRYDETLKPIFGLATLAIVSTILQGGSWPEELTTRLEDYMEHMRDHVSSVTSTDASAGIDG
jgi:hypothetical protein